MGFLKLFWKPCAIILLCALTGWRLHGIALVAVQEHGGGLIVAAGPLPILARISPALVLAAWLPVLLLSRIVRKRAEAAAQARYAAAMDEAAKAKAWGEKAAAIAQEQARALHQEQQRSSAGLKARYEALDRDRAMIDEQRAYVERIEGELRGARDHVRRLRQRLAEAKSQ